MTSDIPNPEPNISAKTRTESGSRSIFRISRLGSVESLTQRQNSLLDLLEVLHRERLDPAFWVAQYAQEERGWYRRKLHQFANRLAKGTSWIEALEQTPNILSDDQVLALRLASQSGTLAPTFVSLRTVANKHRDTVSSWTSMLVYWCVLGAVLIGMLMFLEWYIVPTYKKMFTEMGMAFPANSIFRSVPWQWIVGIGFATIGIVVLGILVGWSAPIRHWIRKWFTGSWFSPSVATTTAPVLRMIAITAREGRPIVGALSTLAKYHSDSRLQQRLLLARNEMEQGASDWESLRISGLISDLEQQALESSSDKGSQAWILEQLASKRELDSQKRRIVLENWLHPVIAIMFGGIIFWLAYSTIGSIYFLVEHLA